ncbi:hypothetical protein GCK72_000975 [Caenorhabditis remanei]|uniref:Uncharacterized protein n=1 Tax=Caenorhabditis remanei TaxID=31234 RepID=A0A6A5HPK5_CAERE|nr:hypothetical protein GCK72_000975 [Caenorhabditis remanei]KAF1769161.1 hypothetical protein GCK72_000975 [Caenorhabditis remanei]
MHDTLLTTMIQIVSANLRAIGQNERDVRINKLSNAAGLSQDVLNQIRALTHEQLLALLELVVTLRQ